MEYQKTKKHAAVKKEGDPVLKKHVGLIHCENKLTFLQRKICNILLFNALDGIGKEEIHQLPLKQLCSLIGYRSNDINLIKKSIKSLISTVMEWNLLEDNKFVNEDNFSEEAISWNASALLAGASIERGIVRYSYSPQIKTVLSSLEIYGRINLFVQAKFNSSYSLVLYENCVRFKNIGKTSWFKLSLFRSLMGVMKDQYESFKELKRNVINVALNEINLKSDIFIEPVYQKVSRSVSAIRFLITENNNYQPSFKRMVKAAEQEEENDLVQPSQTALIDLLSAEFHLAEKQVKDILSLYPPDYILEKVAVVRQSKKVDNPQAYLMAALKKDYKKASLFAERDKKGVQNTYLRETGEASQVRSLKKKYLEYKFKVVQAYLSQQGLLEKMGHEFIQFITMKNPIMGALYKKKGLQSQPAMAEFIEYVQQYDANVLIEFLGFDEYLTAEEVV